MTKMTTKIRVSIAISTFKGFVAGAYHYYVSLTEFGEKTRHLHSESFVTKAQARIWAREMWEEHFDDDEHFYTGLGGVELPWMYTREGD